MKPREYKTTHLKNVARVLRICMRDAVIRIGKRLKFNWKICGKNKHLFLVIVKLNGPVTGLEPTEYVRLILLSENMSGMSPSPRQLHKSSSS